MTNAAYQRALILHQQGRYPDAEQQFRQSLAQNPHDPLAHAMLGLCLAKLKRFPEATQEAQTAIAEAPDLPFGHYVLSKVMAERNRLEEALAAIQEAIRLAPYDADYLAMLSAVRLEQRLWPAALEAAQQGLLYDPEHVDCTNLRAVALVKLGRRAEAGLTIGAALARQPEDARTHANQGWALLHQGEARKAMEHFQEALRLDPQMEWARAGIVEALKARFFIYRWLLMYFLWMARLSQRAQWGIVLGGYFGWQALHSFAQQNPQWAPYVWPVLIAYVCFAALTWLADPMFNLLLRLSRFGRLALSREQTVASNWIGSVLLAGLVSTGFYFATGRDPWLVLAIVCGCILLPLSGFFKLPEGWPRLAMLIALCVLAAMGLTVAVVAFSLNLTPKAARPLLFEASVGLLNVFVWGCVIATFAKNALAFVRQKR